MPVVRLPLNWIEPLHVAVGLRDRDGLCVLLSAGQGRSLILTDPDAVFAGPASSDVPFDRLRQPGWERGVIGLVAYDLGARTATGERDAAEPDGWPDLMLARYSAWLEFDHDTGRLHAVGLGEDTAKAESSASRATAWLDLAVAPDFPEPPASSFSSESEEETYRQGVAEIVARIEAGELFQANLARGWMGRLRPDAEPFDALIRLAGRASAYGAYLRFGDRSLVSNSPELFVSLDAATGRIVSRPIKGTRVRQADPARDAEMAGALKASAKDRAENLMIVDLMRNDLARVARPGSVKVETLFEIETLPTVHHLVSTVTAVAADGTGPADLLDAAFPPGSITGAPKHQAMKVIAELEPPRGPWCGTLLVLDDTGSLQSSVLIRTAAFARDGEGGWRFRTLAGAGIVADSDPQAELDETDAKIAAIRTALIG